MSDDTDVTSLVAKINKEYGKDILDFASNLKYSEIQRLSSGSLFLDYALGTNKQTKQAGWPQGRIIELFGPESSGKSLICLKTIAEAQKAGFLCVYMDCENTFDKEFSTHLGVDTSKLILSQENVLEKVIDLACSLLKQYPDDIKVIVFDSIATMIPTYEIEKPLDEKGQMATVASAMSKALRKLNYFNKNKALLIFINQLRMNPGAGMYANPEYTPGGRAIKFYASVRADIRRGEYLLDEEDKKKKIGQVVKFKIVKNKTDIPFREGYFKFIYETGELDKVDELFSLGLLRNVITRKGPYYSLNEHTFRGRELMEEELLNNTAFFEEARKEIFDGVG
jgi:recombination protein RecA